MPRVTHSDLSSGLQKLRGRAILLLEAHLHRAVHCQVGWPRGPADMKFPDARVAGRILTRSRCCGLLPGERGDGGSQLEGNRFQGGLIDLVLFLEQGKSRW